MTFTEDIKKAENHIPQKRERIKGAHLSESGSLLPNYFATWRYWKDLMGLTEKADYGSKNRGIIKTIKNTKCLQKKK